jgi:hypothetical protein
VHRDLPLFVLSIIQQVCASSSCSFGWLSGAFCGLAAPASSLSPTAPHLQASHMHVDPSKLEPRKIGSMAAMTAMSTIDPLH